MQPLSSAKALLEHFDSLIEKHQHTADPELLQDLRAHRAALQEAANKRDFGEYAKTALRLATWIKFIHDQWPDL